MGEVLEWHPSNVFADRNLFRTMVPDFGRPPTLEQSCERLPDPFWAGREDAIACYWKTWEIAFRNLRQVTPQSGFVAPFIDTAFNDYLFLWDSAFIVMFGRYGSRAFNFQRTLDDLYCKQEPDGYISREISERDGTGHFNRHSPFGTGPNVLAWSEWEYFQNFKDRERLAAIYPVLLAYHIWTRHNRSWPDGTYWSTGLGCGMDNQPRTPAGYDCKMEHGHMSWLDATAQAILSAQMLGNMARVLRVRDGVVELNDEIRRLAKIINGQMWNARTRFYHDKDRNGRLLPVKSIGAYWLLLTGIVPAGRMAAFIAHLDNPREFKRPHRVPTLSADHPAYRSDGGYWLGGVWAPTNYMLLRGLTRNGMDDLAFDIACNHHQAVMHVFNDTGTLWENYAPERDKPGKPAKKDFVGWSGLVPIAVLFEYVFGLRAAAQHGRLVWDIRLTEAFGVRRYPFGHAGVLDLACAARTSPRAEPQVAITANVPLTVELRWPGGRRLLKVKGAPAGS